MAIGAAAAAVVALVVTGILVTRDDDVEPAAGLPVATDTASPGSAVETSIVETVAPTTVAPTTIAPTTVAPTTQPPARTDAELAEAVLLDEPEYAEGWFEAPHQNVILDGKVAATVPSCAPYVDVVFEGAGRPSEKSFRWFYSPDPRAVMSQYVVVLPDVATASAMFDAAEDPAFLNGCLRDYLATIPVVPCCSGEGDFTPLYVDGMIEAPTVDLAGDQSTVRAYEGSWIDEQGVSHGPEKSVSATIRVGRVVFMIEGLLEVEGGTRQVLSLEDFQQIVARAVAKTETALSD